MKIIKRIISSGLVLMIMLSSVLITNAAYSPDEERDLLVNMFSGLEIEYYDSSAPEYLADILIESELANMDNLSEYLQKKGYYSNFVSDIINLFEGDPVAAREVLTKDDLEWGIEVLIKGTVEEETDVNHYLRNEAVKDLFSYFVGFYDLLYNNFESLCPQEKIDYLFVKTFAFYVNYSLFYAGDREALMDLIMQSNTESVQEPVNVLDLGDWKESWKYDNVTVSKNLTRNNRSVTDCADVVNLSSNSLNADQLDYAMQLADNGAVVIVQNKNEINTCAEMTSFLDIPEPDIKLEIDSNNYINIGYCIKSSEAGTNSIEPIFATVMKPDDSEEPFDLTQELVNLKNSSAAYIDPVDYYNVINNAATEQQGSKLQQNTSEKGRLQASPYKNQSAYGYLCRKGGDVKWGIISGYTKLAYVHVNVNITRGNNSGGYNYDQVDTTFMATGMGGEYIDKYVVFDRVDQNAYMYDSVYLNQQSKYTLSTTYTWGGDGLSVGTAMSTEVNPGEQCLTTNQLNNYVAWHCIPNSNLKDRTWKINTGFSTRKVNGYTAKISCGFEELVVAGSGKRYTSPNAVVANVQYS